MGITVHIYNTPTAPEHLYKDITNEVSPEGGYTGDVRGDISVDAPVILIQATILSGNYVYIPEFGRYYWITDRNIERTDLTELTLKSDPLMSFASQILTLPIYVTRTEQRATEEKPLGWNSYLHDSNIPKTSREFTIIKIDTTIPKFEYPDSSVPDSRQYVFGVIG